MHITTHIAGFCTFGHNLRNKAPIGLKFEVKAGLRHSLNYSLNDWFAKLVDRLVGSSGTHMVHSPTIFDFLRKMEGQNFLHSIQVYTHVHGFPSRLTPVKGPQIYVVKNQSLHKIYYIDLGALNRGQSRWKSMHMGINLNAVQKF